MLAITIIPAYVSFQVFHFLSLQEFENVECQWPLFFMYMIIDGMFKGSTEQVNEYHTLLKKVVHRDNYGGEHSK